MPVPLEVLNLLLLVGQALAYFSVMSVLFRLRTRVGIGVFVCALGVMHFLETYLASVFYIELPFGIISPGSTVLFSGKLLMILLLYIKEDAATVRQPIYGLLIGNFLIVGMVVILRNHEVVTPMPGREPDISFVDEMGWLMVWGTTLLFLDAIGIILLYEKLGGWLRNQLMLRIFISSAVMLTFDQVGFYLALHYVTGAPIDVLFGGWAAKMGAALLFSALTLNYLRLFERDVAGEFTTRLSDVFDTLTYRERYQDLLARAGHDALTNVFGRGQFDGEGRDIVARAMREGSDVSILAIDVDGLRAVNDSFGRKEGDALLRAVAHLLSNTLGKGDRRLYRYGGDTFTVIAPGLSHDDALRLGERLRRRVRRADLSDRADLVTVSVGVATAPGDGSELDTLFDAADARVAKAKNAGRDRVVGEAGVITE